MKSKEFVGKIDVNNPTPTGGMVRVAFGDIITEGEDEKLEAIAIHIEDQHGNIVTQFALQPATFGVLIESIKELYDDAFRSVPNVPGN